MPRSLPLHTQILPHLLEVVQIIRHGVGEVHEDIQVHGALQGLEHLQLEVPLLARPQPHPQRLGGHLAAAQRGVNLPFLRPREGDSWLEGLSRSNGDRSAQPGDPIAPHKQPALSLPPPTPDPRHLRDLEAALHDHHALQPAAGSQQLGLGVTAPFLEHLARRRRGQGALPVPAAVLTPDLRPSIFLNPCLFSHAHLARGWAEGVASVTWPEPRGGARGWGGGRAGQQHTSSVQ